MRCLLSVYDKNNTAAQSSRSINIVHLTLLNSDDAKEEMLQKHHTSDPCELFFVQAPPRHPMHVMCQGLPAEKKKKHAGTTLPCREGLHLYSVLLHVKHHKQIQHEIQIKSPFVVKSWSIQVRGNESKIREQLNGRFQNKSNSVVKAR